MLMTKAYAKINLGLNVINKDEEDGYHNVDMIVVPIELHAQREKVRRVNTIKKSFFIIPSSFFIINDIIQSISFFVNTDISR